MDNEAPKSFIYRAEAILIAVGFFASSSGVYMLLIVLGIVALAVYVVWLRASPVRLAGQSR